MINVTFDAEITKDPQFEQQLKGIIAEFETERKKAEEAAYKHGNRLKASPLLNLMQQGKFTYDFIMSEFPRVADKTSTLPSSQRDIIGSVVFNAAKRTVIVKQAERARQIEEKANARVAQEEAEATATNSEPEAAEK